MQIICKTGRQRCTRRRGGVAEDVCQATSNLYKHLRKQNAGGHESPATNNKLVDGGAAGEGRETCSVCLSVGLPVCRSDARVTGKFYTLGTRNCL